MTTHLQRTISKPRKPRPLLYLYKDPHEKNCYWFHGITFAEFFHALQLHTHLLFIAYGNLDIEGDESRLGFINAPPPSVRRLTSQDVYSQCGDFMWIDIPASRDTERLSPEDLAHLLYLSKTFKPLPHRTPLFQSLGNRFAYLAHDDGYVLKLYCRYRKDLLQLVGNIVAQKARAFGLKLQEKNIARETLRLAPRGALIEFAQAAGLCREIPLSIAGPFTCMDDLLNGIAAGTLHLKRSSALGVAPKHASPPDTHPRRRRLPHPLQKPAGPQ